MVWCISLLLFVPGVLTLHMEGVLGSSDESSDSSPGYQKNYYLFQMLPIQRLKGKPENAFERKAAELLAKWSSSTLGAPDLRPAENMLARIQPQPAPAVPRQSPTTQGPSMLGSTALRRPVLTLSTPSKITERISKSSVPGTLGSYYGMSVRFSLTSQVLTTPDVPTKEALHSTSPPTFSTSKEPRGDV